MLYKTPGLSQYISGVILHVETLFQKDAEGKQMVDLITGNGMIPRIKLDKGYDKPGLPGTGAAQETLDRRALEVLVHRAQHRLLVTNRDLRLQIRYALACS